MLQFGVSLTYDTSSVNYDRNMFIIQATEQIFTFGNTANVKGTYYFSTHPRFQHRPLGLIAQDYTPYSILRIQFMDSLNHRSLD
jgi:hypothetical protein